MVHFVGAGPGAVDLITVRGKKMLEEADVIIYAGSLVNPELLSYARPGTKILNSATMSLPNVIAEMKDAESKGLTTVRLHTGDPSLYGAIREQIDELKTLGIAYDVCPGVSAAFGAAASLGLEYTLPDVSQSLLITRVEGRTPVPEKESLSSCAALHCSMVLYLSAGLSEKVKKELLAGGYAKDTPVAVVYKATWPDEKILRTTLDALPEDMKQAGINHTALIMIGDVLADTYEKSKLYDPTFATGYRSTKESSPLGFKNVAVIVTSKGGTLLLDRIRKTLSDASYGDGRKEPQITEYILAHDDSGYRPGDTLASVTKEAWEKADALIFASATGIAVRAVAPYLSHKSKDPAVITMDEQGRYVISLLSGHAGGANRLASAFASDMLAQPVVTTATDLAGKFSVDTYAREHGLVVTDWKKAKEISVLALAGEEIKENEHYIVSNRLDENEKRLRLVPKNIVCGIGARKGILKERVLAAIGETFGENGYDIRAIAKFTSIDLKKDEAGIIESAEELSVPYVTFSAEELRSVEAVSTSEFVKETTGVDSVCEQSALYEAKKLFGEQAHLLVTKQATDGVTVALAGLGDE